MFDGLGVDEQQPPRALTQLPRGLRRVKQRFLLVADTPQANDGAEAPQIWSSQQGIPTCHRSSPPTQERCCFDVLFRVSVSSCCLWLSGCAALRLSFLHVSADARSCDCDNYHNHDHHDPLTRSNSAWFSLDAAAPATTRPIFALSLPTLSLISHTQSCTSNSHYFYHDVPIFHPGTRVI